jgi:hypothetical protein
MAGLTTKLTIPVTLIATLAIGLTAFLNLGKFDRTLGDLHASRARYILNEIHAAVDIGLGLGLPLRSVVNAQAVIEYELRRNPEIAAIVIHDEQGAVVFQAGAALADGMLPTSWRPHAVGKRAAGWSLREEGHQVVGAGLTSVIGAPVGGVALRYATAEQERTVASMAAYLSRMALTGILLTAAATALGIGFLHRRISRRLQRIAGTLDSGAPGAGTSEAVALAGEIASTSQAALQEIASRRAALATLPAPDEVQVEASARESR